MTADDFRRIALGMEGAVERAHHGHPDFRVAGRIFATLGYPNREWGMVNLTPEQQRAQVRDHPQAFEPVKGTWGQQGSTNVRLDAVDDETLGEAMTLAWQRTRQKSPPTSRAQAPATPRAKSQKAAVTVKKVSSRPVASRRR